MFFLLGRDAEQGKDPENAGSNQAIWPRMSALLNSQNTL